MLQEVLKASRPHEVRARDTAFSEAEPYAVSRAEPR